MSFLNALGLRAPILQAPMAGVQDHALAVAVAQGGGLGALPAAMLSPQALHAELSALQVHTPSSFNVNFFCHAPVPVADAALARWQQALQPLAQQWGVAGVEAPPAAARRPFDAESLAVLQAFRPAVVSFHFGLPAAELLAPIRAWGGRILASATTVAEARWLEAHGADAVIAQGLEAGGHRGHFLDEDLSLQSGTFALLPQIVRAVSVPVIAAGGIGTADEVRAARRLGAAAVQVGSAYLRCDEARTSAVHRAALCSPGAAHTTLTRIFTGRPARGIVNGAIRALGAMNAEAPPFPHAAGAWAPLRAKAEAAGSGDCSPLWAGQNLSGCIGGPAAALTAALVAAWQAE